MIAKATSGTANTNKRIVVAASCAGIFLAVLALDQRKHGPAGCAGQP